MGPLMEFGPVEPVVAAVELVVSDRVAMVAMEEPGPMQELEAMEILDKMLAITPEPEVAAVVVAATEILVEALA
jgi:hypothetical protein